MLKSLLTTIHCWDVIGYIDASTLLSHQRTVHTIDFSLVENVDLQDFTIGFEFAIERTGIGYFMFHDFGIFFS